MTHEELKAEAKAQGYNLIRASSFERFIPCTCGCNRREHWNRYDSSSDCYIITLKCKRCGRKVSGRGEWDARQNWNALMREEQEHESDSNDTE